MDLVKYEGRIELLSPLAHNSDESCGTDTKFRRVDFFCDNKRIAMPCYSGNAFRGILRRICARQYCDLIGIEVPGITDKPIEKLVNADDPEKGMSPPLYYCFFSGGSLKKGSTQSYIEIGAKRELRRMIPFLSLFGSAAGNQIFAGKIAAVDMCVPICKETVKMTQVESPISIWETTTEIFYTRRDDLEDAGEKEQAHQMKYTIETLAPGIVLRHGLVLEGVNDVEHACFAYGMQKFQEIGRIGGKGGTGHGRVKMEYEPGWPDTKPYLDYVNANKDGMIEYIRSIEKKL